MASTSHAWWWAPDGTHQSGTSMGALGVISPRFWSKPFYFPKIWWRCEVLGGVKSSFTPKDFWAWYVLILSCCFSISPPPLFFKLIITNHMHLYSLFGVILILFFSFQGCPKYIQALGDDQLLLSAIGWGEEKEACCCANLGCSETSNANLKKKLTAKEQAWKSADLALEGAERQAKS